MIKELIAQGKSKEEIIELYIGQGFARSIAEFIYAIENGEIDGDVIEATDDEVSTDEPINPN